MARVADQLSDGQKVLAITFTKKAAREMRERISQLTKGAEERLTVGTFHQCCLDILRTHGDQAGLPAGFKIASADEIEALSRRLWPEASARERKDSLIGISRWKAAACDESAPAEVERYNKALRESARLDFDDLLLETLLLLRSHPGVLAGLRHQYAHIFVDEYQDINAVQNVLLKILVGAGNTITAIGDPNQAIYGFRGSDNAYFGRFADDFPGASIMSLADNYRSAQNILSASGQVMADSGTSGVPPLTAQIYQKGRLRIHTAATDQAEAEYVTHNIEKMVGGTSMFSHDSARVDVHQESSRSFGDIAVFYRLHAQGRLVQKALERHGISYQVTGGTASDDPEQEIAQGYLSPPDEPDTRAEKVSLMTLHASKGLEFPAVFIVGCEDNILPLGVGNMTSDSDEERRLFYVGMTRAEEELFLVRAKQRFLFGQKYHNEPSPFLSDIEEALKEVEQPAPLPKRAKKREDQPTLF